MWQKSANKQFLGALEHTEYGSIHLVMPDGASYGFAGPSSGTHATFYVRDWRVLPLFAGKGDIGLAEAYRDGWWDSDDLAALFIFGLQNEHALQPFLYGSLFGQVISRMMYLFNRNTLRGSKRNIHAHYDLGNRFFSLWLDPSMSYSSALFTQPNQSLEQAQYHKYDRIIERLGGESGSMLEVGCGWGGFADRAVQTGDFAVKAITLSQEQCAYAQQRVGRQAQIALEDYRHQQGHYDYLVSIEMFEAVGERFWPTYFAKMKSLLHTKGRAMVQTITIADPYFDAYRKGGDMIRSFIFPGGMLPSLTRFEQEARAQGMQVTDHFAFGQDYALTLRHWLQAFEAKLPQIRALGFDDAFIRIWRFYLAACIASFSVGRTDVMQLELCHA